MLSGLTNLTELYLGNNQISNINVLSGLKDMYAKFRDKNRYKEFLERQKAIRKANMANSPLGKFGARVKKLLNPNEQQDSPENTTNDSNAGEA